MGLIEIKRNPSRRDLAWFGAILAAFCGVVGTVLWWKFGVPRAATIVWGVGLVVAALYYAVRPLRRPIFVGWMYAVFPIGWIISHVILALVYYLVLTPCGLLMRIAGRDPLQRKLDPEAESYWIEHEQMKDRNRYFRQF